MVQLGYGRLSGRHTGTLTAALGSVVELVSVDGDSLNLLTGGFLALGMLAEGMSTLVCCLVSTLDLSHFIGHDYFPPARHCAPVELAVWLSETLAAGD